LIGPTNREVVIADTRGSDVAVITLTSSLACAVL
jgi:hypothetical protein